MRRRLDLAASLAGQPSVIFLDEPTTGLDLPSRQLMWQVIGGLAPGPAGQERVNGGLVTLDNLDERVGAAPHGPLDQHPVVGVHVTSHPAIARRRPGRSLQSAGRRAWFASRASAHARR